MIDPRIYGAKKMLSRVRVALPVMSGKGGVGKTLVSVALSLSLAREGASVGLLDLDFTGPNCHVVLGVRRAEFVEDKGIIPPEVHGVRFASIALFAEDKPVPLRGEERTNAILELLSITRWGDLDILVIDMPPGVGDEVLDISHVLGNATYLLVTTPSALSMETVRRAAMVLLAERQKVLGVVGNMIRREEEVLQLKEFSSSLGLRYLATIPFDEEVEAGVGNPELLLRTSFGRAVSELSRAVGEVLRHAR